jgi:hypothetical protein
MRATHDQQVITLFDGERIAPGYRGRRNSPQIAIKLIAIAFAAAFIGIATAATAIAVRNANDTERSIRAGGNLAGGVSGSVGFEAALY